MDERCKLTAVLGIGGIGKTVLAPYAAAHVQQQFSVVIWCSLRNAPPLAELPGQCISVLANHAEYQLAPAVEQRLDLLFQYLSGQRCLLVLNSFESILQDKVAGSYLPGFEGYGDLVKRFGEDRH